MAPVNTLKYPKKSHRKTVLLPSPSIKLAEFFGIMMGDGAIGNSWQAVISLNSKADASYAVYVQDLIFELFGIQPKVSKRKESNTLLLTLTSTDVVDFLLSKGLVYGDKIKGNILIPEWILNNDQYRRACVRGLMDTDGCLYIHRHVVSNKRYENLGLCFTSYAQPLLRQVAVIFEQFGVIPHISSHGRRIYLYSAKSVAKYVTVFGSSNDRILSIYEKWRRRIAV